MIFLDCYGRVFQLDDESQFLWPLGDSPEEAQKYSTDGDELGWFVENGVVREYIRKPQCMYCMQKKKLLWQHCVLIICYVILTNFYIYFLSDVYPEAKMELEELVKKISMN
jgi:hypothetical protein